MTTSFKVLNRSVLDNFSMDRTKLKVWIIWSSLLDLELFFFLWFSDLNLEKPEHQTNQSTKKKRQSTTKKPQNQKQAHYSKEM